MYADALSDGRVESVLSMSDVSLTSCPAPAVLCLLANLIQIGRTCEAISGVNPTVFHYTGAAEYFNFLASLINSAPLGTFSSRMSAVEWVSVGASSTPVVLSDVVIEQASAILSDSYVRALFTLAINDDELNTKTVINTKTEKDGKHEKDVEDIGMSSATSVAAKEALADRNRSFWQSSKWAKKLTTLLSGPENHAASKSTDSNRGVGKLMNTSSISRQLANGKGSVTNAVLSSQGANHEYSVLFLLALCRVYGTIISRWGGNGKEDLVRRARRSIDCAKFGKEFASANIEPCVTALLNVLCFSTSVVMSSWAIVQSNARVVSDLYAVIDVSKGAAPIRMLSINPTYKRLQHSHYGACDGNVGAATLLLFVTCMSHTLIVTDDVEIHEME
jgi:ubiquitin-protein ligase E3 C